MSGLTATAGFRCQFLFSCRKINVGKEFQAELPKCNPGKQRIGFPLVLTTVSFCKDESPADTVHKAIKVWKPPPDLTQEEEDTVDGYLELACSPVMPHAGRNKEFALHTLYQTKGSIKVLEYSLTHLLMHSLNHFMLCRKLFVC